MKGTPEETITVTRERLAEVLSFAVSATGKIRDSGASDEVVATALTAAVFDRLTADAKEK